MKLSIDIDTTKEVVDIKYVDLEGNVVQVKAVYKDDKLVWRQEDPPSFNSLSGEDTDVAQITLTYDIVDGGESVNKIEYKVGDGDWVDTNNTALSSTIVIDDLAVGDIYTLTVRATNDVGSTEESLDVYVSGDYIAWSEDGTTADRTQESDDWVDTNNYPDPIAGGNVRVRDADSDSDGKFIQINYLAWNISNGTFRGTRRLTHPYQYFNLDSARAYELSVDWFFEEVHTWNTIGRDPDEIAQRFFDYGRSYINEDGLLDKQTFNTLQDALDWVNANLFGENELTGSGNPYFDTGFPYQVGKMHGLATRYPLNATPAGGTEPSGGDPAVNGYSESDWSVRVAWVKNTETHPATSGTDANGDPIYTDGDDPNVPPTLALYIYDQDGNQKYVYLDNFTNLSQNTWYVVKLFVQTNDFGKHNGIAELKVYDRETDTLLDSVRVDNLKLHNVQDGSGNIGRFQFDTSYGGGDAKYSPQLDPDWADLPNIDVNSGTYARNDNYVATRLASIIPPTIESEDYSTGDLVLTASHTIPWSQIDDIEYNILPGGGSYDPENWTSVTSSGDASYSIVGGKAEVTIDSAVVNTNDKVFLRVCRDNRCGARSDDWLVEFPTVPVAPAIDSIERGDEQLTLSIIPPQDDGNASVTDYEYRLNGGSPVSIGVSGGTYPTPFEYIITGLDNNISYTIEVRAINSEGSSAWSVGVSEYPIDSYTIPVSQTNLIRYYDPAQEDYNDTDNVSSLTDRSGFSDMAQYSNPPIFKTNQINGEPAIEFSDGVGMEDDGTGLLDLDFEGSIYIVAKVSDVFQRGSFFSTTPWEQENILNIHPYYELNSGDKAFDFSFGNRDSGGRLLVNSGAPPENEWNIWEFRVKDGLMNVYKNGVKEYEQLTSSKIDLTAHKLRMGWSTDGWLYGSIAIAFMYKVFFEDTSQNRVDILTYLQNRFGIACEIPSIIPPDVVSFSVNTVGVDFLVMDYEVNPYGAEITGLEYEVDGDGNWISSGILDASGQFTIPSGSGLTTDVQASIKLRVTTTVGQGTSDSVLETPTAGPPSFDDFSFASKTNDSLTFDFDIAENGASLTDIEYTYDGGQNWISLSLTNPSSFTISGLNESTSYNVQMRATNSSGTTNSQILNEVTSSNITELGAFFGSFRHLELPTQYQSPQYVNVGFPTQATWQLQRVIDTGVKVVANMPWMQSSWTNAKITQEIEEYAQAIQSIDKSKIEFFFMGDEPHIKGISIEQQQHYFDEAKRIIGSEFRYGFSYPISMILGWPTSAELIEGTFPGLFFYPFRNKSAFTQSMNTRLDELRDAASNYFANAFGGTDYWAYVQAFDGGNQDWTPVPVEFPDYVAEWINNDAHLKGAFTWANVLKTEDDANGPKKYDNDLLDLDYLFDAYMGLNGNTGVLNGLNNVSEPDPEPDPSTFFGGGGETPDHAPSNNPADWEVLADEFLIPSQTTWGGQNASQPGGTILHNGNIRLIYTGKSSGDFRGCIADFDGTTIVDGQNNPVLDDLRSWQYYGSGEKDWRQHPTGVFDVNGTINVYYNVATSGASNQYFGNRAIGFCESFDNGETYDFSKYDSGPVITVETLAPLYGEIDLVNGDQENHGIVYCRGAFRFDGETYLFIRFSTFADPNGRDWDEMDGCIKSADGVTGWSRVQLNLGQYEDPPIYQVVEYNGKYYTAMPEIYNGKRGAKILEADTPTGQWNTMEYQGVEQPMFDTGFYDVSHREMNLFFYNGKWHVALCLRGSAEKDESGNLIYDSLEDIYGWGSRVIKIGREK